MLLRPEKRSAEMLRAEMQGSVSSISRCRIPRNGLMAIDVDAQLPRSTSIHRYWIADPDQLSWLQDERCILAGMEFPHCIIHCTCTTGVSQRHHAVRVGLERDPSYRECSGSGDPNITALRRVEFCTRCD